MKDYRKFKYDSTAEFVGHLPNFMIANEHGTFYQNMERNLIQNFIRLYDRGVTSECWSKSTADAGKEMAGITWSLIKEIPSIYGIGSDEGLVSILAYAKLIADRLNSMSDDDGDDERDQEGDEDDEDNEVDGHKKYRHHYDTKKLLKKFKKAHFQVILITSKTIALWNTYFAAFKRSISGAKVDSFSDDPSYKEVISFKSRVLEGDQKEKLEIPKDQLAKGNGSGGGNKSKQRHHGHRGRSGHSKTAAESSTRTKKSSQRHRH